MTTTAPRALLYGRVSLDRTREGKSVDQQLTEGRKVADRQGWVVVGEHRDDGVSASRYARGKARPGWQAAMEQITAGRVDLLVVWEISRATRDRAPWAALIAACTDTGTRIAVDGKVHDPADPDDGFMLDLTAALSVRESGVTAKRIRRDVDARAQVGRPHGRVPYGYTRTYDPHDGRLVGQVPDAETGPVVQEIVRRVLAGEACYGVAADLNRRGVPSPLMVTHARNGKPVDVVPWRQDQVRRVAGSPTNAGLRVHRGAVIPGVDATWEPLVSRADHAAVAGMLSDPRRRHNLAGESVSKHLLVGLATCGDCGAIVRKIKNRGTPSYSCSRGFHVARAMHFVDAYVTEVVLTRLERPDVADLFNDADDGARAAQDTARAELAELRATLDGWYAAAVEGSVTPSGLAKIETGLLAKIAQADERARPRPSSPVMRDMLTGDVRTRWAEAPVTARREVIRELITVTIHRTRRGARHLDPETVEIGWRSPS